MKDEEDSECLARLGVIVVITGMNLDEPVSPTSTGYCQKGN